MTFGRSFFFLIGSAFLLSLFGCVKPPLQKTPEKGPPKTLGRTHGDFRILSGQTLSLAYKNMSLIFDPAAKNISDWKKTSPFDYVLITGAPGKKDLETISQNLRKNVKILSTEDGKRVLRQKGFASIKAISSGQRVLLKKEGNYLFVNAVSYKKDAIIRNAYFLEFDNGRNVFVMPQLDHPDKLRTFVYDLRDDGKAIHMGLFGQDATNLNQFVPVVSLLQPELAVLHQKEKANVDYNTIEKELEENLFYGNFRLAQSGDQLPF